MQPELTSREDEGVSWDLLCWRLPSPMLVASTAAIGGGVGERSWILNVQVSHDYGRRDVERHVAEIAQHLGLRKEGVGMMTAAAVGAVVHEDEMSIDTHVTVGVRKPTWAASDEAAERDGMAIGTINIVAFLPVRLSPGGLLNALTTATEAKSQALWDAGVAATGTASDAVCVVCPIDGPEDPFGGPRSVWGSPLARTVHRAVLAGIPGGRS